MAKSRIKNQTLQIVKELIAEAERIRETNAIDRGFRTRLAKRYGLTRGRITNIARSAGLTDSNTS